MTGNVPFHDHALEISREFLQTAVVIDDELFENSSRIVEPEAPSSQLAGRAVKANLLEPPEPRRLPARPLVEAFAKAGLICGLVAPRAANDAYDQLLKATKSADLVVIDWVIGSGEKGQLARKVIDALIGDVENGKAKRLRAVAIYTGQPDIVEIVDGLIKHLETTFGGSVERQGADEFSFSFGPVHIAVYAKEHADPAGTAAGQVRTPEDLPGQLIADFTRLTEGLVSGVALQSLAALRKDTYRILNVLNSGMDIGYLGHRSALVDPPDAEQHLLEMVASEIWAVLDDHAASRVADVAAISSWIDDPDNAAKWGANIPVAAGEQPKPLSVAQVQLIVAKGLGRKGSGAAVSAAGGQQPGANHLESRVKKDAHLVFSDDPVRSERSHNEFCMKMNVRTSYGLTPRMLRSGTIIRSGETYLLCVLPLCDSVRLTPGQSQSFPFLRLKTAVLDGPVRLVLQGSAPGVYLRFALPVNPSNLSVCQFQAGAEWDVRFSPDGEGQLILTDAQANKYVWVADLKPEVARTIGVELGQQFARLGVDEPEILRLSRPQLPS
jgi:hypothetical protein